MKPTLVVLAAGMGSRYGGLKQIDPVGPSGEVILDYSVYDALRAGFGKVVFVIRKDIEQAFREALGAHFEGKIAVEYAFQSLDDLPGAFRVPEGRSKPWGTTQATLACRGCVKEPFGVINADDFYGRSSFQKLADALRQRTGRSGDFLLIGFPLRNTVSDYGTVSRGVCTLDAAGRLVNVEECLDIRPVSGGIELRRGADLEVVDGSQPVSMNMWGFTPDFFREAQAGFARFLTQIRDPQRTEYYLPSAVQEMMDQGKATVEVLASDDRWLGVTYPEDKPLVRAGLQRLIDTGVYPPSLWG
jgi:dTDP-glucose pyrophosphorylase